MSDDTRQPNPAPPDLYALRRLVEVEREVTFWGSPYTITPRVIPEIFGDGQQLVHLHSLNTRPNYYVAAVDSLWGVQNDDEDPLCDHLEELLEAIEEEWPCVCNDLDEEVTEEDREACTFPAPHFDCGASWGEYRLSDAQRALVYPSGRSALPEGRTEP